MKKRIWLLPLLILTSVLLTGCALQTVNEMYALPKRSKEYDSLQSAIDSAMYGLSYSAPVSGENRQTVQMADLDGDGNSDTVMEHIRKIRAKFAAASLYSYIETVWGVGYKWSG